MELAPILDFPGYFASADGHIYWTKRGELIRKAERVGNKRRLFISIGTKDYAVHRLVCSAFHGRCPEGMETRHFDGNCQNNHKDNLLWGTQLENHHDSVRLGVFKLNYEKANAIRESYQAGRTKRSIAEEFGVSTETVRLIARNKIWCDSA